MRIFASDKTIPIYDPAVARESTATITPCAKRNASVVVPWCIRTRHEPEDASSVLSNAKRTG